MKRAASLPGICLAALLLLAAFSACSTPPAKIPEPASQPPAPTLEASTVEEVKVVKREIEGYLGGLRYPYNKALKANPGLEGKLKVSLTISQTGWVADVALVESTLPAELTRELLAKMRHWTFSVKPATSFVVTYPIVFFPPK